METKFYMINFILESSKYDYKSSPAGSDPSHPKAQWMPQRSNKRPVSWCSHIWHSEVVDFYNQEVANAHQGLKPVIGFYSRNTL